MRTDLVGRRRELAVLTDCLHAALAGDARLVLCRGEPGIGKTRLAEELAATAGPDVVTAWGATEDTAGAPPYWPWHQVLRTLGEHVDLAAIAGHHRLVADVGRLAPDLFPGPEDRPESQLSDESRFRSFDAVARLLREATRVRPVLIILDDAHCASGSSLL